MGEAPRAHEIFKPHADSCSKSLDRLSCYTPECTLQGYATWAALCRGLSHLGQVFASFQAMGARGSRTLPLGHDIVLRTPRADPQCQIAAALLSPSAAKSLAITITQASTRSSKAHCAHTMTSGSADRGSVSRLRMRCSSKTRFAMSVSRRNVRKPSMPCAANLPRFRGS